jgi:putative acetyltransferase
MRTDDALAFLKVHHAAVRGLAVKDYAAHVIDDWAPIPIRKADVQRFLENLDSEIRLVAERDGAIVGVGALVLGSCELRACYVDPAAIRQGVGSAIVSRIECIARDHGLAHLNLDSSVTAEPFYSALGYIVRERDEHIRASGVRMPCVRMHKALT